MREMGALEGKTIVLGVTGGIAAYKACDLTSRLRKAGAQVFVIMTHNACNFIHPQSFETLSANPVVTDTFSRPERWEVGHVALAKKADLFVVAPCTANMMAKMACGLADDMLSTTLLATSAPVLLAPAMNTGMWNHPATKANVQLLQDRGVLFVGPEGGSLACGDSGTGRMSEPADILRRAEEILDVRKDLLGLRVLLTAGPTREMIDPVRFITNRSSGKMGYAVAKAALDRGAQVDLISGPVSIAPPQGAVLHSVVTTGDLLKEVTGRCGECDILVQAAAPADYTPLEAAAQKIKKEKGADLTLVLKETPDTAAAAGKLKKPCQVFVGFAAETENLTANARKKLVSKNLDMICLNDVTRKDAGFDVDTNCLTLITDSGAVELPLMTKRQAADRLLDEALRIWKEKNASKAQ